jgi:hypothetical protein
MARDHAGGFCPPVAATISCEIKRIAFLANGASCCTALWSLLAHSDISRQRSNRSLPGIKRTWRRHRQSVTHDPNRTHRRLFFWETRSCVQRMHKGVSHQLVDDKADRHTDIYRSQRVIYFQIEPNTVNAMCVHDGGSNLTDVKPEVDGAAPVISLQTKGNSESSLSTLILPLATGAASISPAFVQLSPRVRWFAFGPMSAPSRRRAPRSAGRARATRRIRRRALRA